MSRARRIVVATTFPIGDAKGGGQTRVVGLYGAIAAQGVAVDVVCLVPYGERALAREIRPGLREIRVPQSRAHHDAEHALRIDVGDVPVTDVALGLHHDLTPAYAEAVRTAATGASAVVACHPYATPVLLEAAPDLPLLYEAQDVETDIKAGILDAGSDAGRAALDAVRDLERLTCERAVQVMTCSREDGDRLGELFGLDGSRVVVVPNGYEGAVVRFTGWDEREANRREVGLERPTVLFVGSWHQPNLEAARAMCEAARSCPDAHFLIVGAAGLSLEQDAVPDNTDVTGPVDGRFLTTVLEIASVAVNPMRSGSGTNLKMLEYAGAGVPLLSSEFGARGLGLVPGEHYVDTEPEAVATGIARLREEGPEVVRRRVDSAHRWVAEHFDWPVIARDWLADDRTASVVAA